MKVLIEKPRGTPDVRVELTFDGAKKPSVVVLGPAQLDMIVQLLQSARNADYLKFALQL